MQKRELAAWKAGRAKPVSSGKEGNVWMKMKKECGMCNRTTQHAHTQYGSPHKKQRDDGRKAV